MLLDRNIGVGRAIATSIEVVRLNPVPMAAWGLIVVLGLVIGSIPVFVGLIFVLPMLGHATWHLYRRVQGFDAVHSGYDRTLKLSLRSSPWMLGVFFATLGLHRLAVHDRAEGLLPPGGHRPALGLDRGAPGHLVRSHGRTAAAGRGRASARRPTWRMSPRASARRRRELALNTGRMFVELKPRSERPTLQNVLARPAPRPRPGCRHRDLRHAGAEPAASAGARRKAEYQFVMQSARPAAALQWSQKMATRWAAIRTSPTSTATCRTTPRRRRWWSTRTRPARSASARTQLRSTLYSGFGSRQVSTIYTHRRQLFGDARVRPRRSTGRPTGCLTSASATASGKLVPIGAFARVERTAGLADDQPARPAAGRDDLVQPAAGRVRSAKRSTRIERAQGRS